MLSEDLEELNSSDGDITYKPKRKRNNISKRISMCKVYNSESHNK